MKGIRISLQLPYCHSVLPTYLKTVQEVQKPKTRQKYHPARTVYSYWNKIQYEYKWENPFSNIFCLKNKEKNTKDI